MPSSVPSHHRAVLAVVVLAAAACGGGSTVDTAATPTDTGTASETTSTPDPSPTPTPSTTRPTEDTQAAGLDVTTAVTAEDVCAAIPEERVEELAGRGDLAAPRPHDASEGDGDREPFCVYSAPDPFPVAVRIMVDTALTDIRASDVDEGFPSPLAKEVEGPAVGDETLHLTYLNQFDGEDLYAAYAQVGPHNVFVLGATTPDGAAALAGLVVEAISG